MVDCVSNLEDRLAVDAAKIASLDIEESRPSGRARGCRLGRQRCPKKRPSTWRLIWVSAVLVLLCHSSAVVCHLWWWTRGAGLPWFYCSQRAVPLEPPNTTAVDDIRRWADGLVSRMTKAEKHSMVNGVGWLAWVQLPNYYVGNIIAIPRLGIPAINMQDAMQGFRTTDQRMIGQVTSWPCALALAATWDAGAVWEWARAVGDEFRAKGANVILGPSVELHRTAFGGRNAEYIAGEDPHLGQRFAAAYVRGAQEGAGVATVVKHWVLNQQETKRTKADFRAGARTLWEWYYPPFEAAVEAGVASVMCAYNYVGGTQACENSAIIELDLKGEMKFEGFVMSDWYAIQSDHAASEGTDMNMPGADGYFSKSVINRLPPGRLDEMARRVLVGMGRASAFTEPDENTTCRAGCNCTELLYDTVATNEENLALTRQLAVDGAVLLKNNAPGGGNGSAPLLPLRHGQRLAVVGSACDARPVELGWSWDWTAADYYVIGGSGRVLSNRTTSIVAGLRKTGMFLRASLTDDVEAAVRAMHGADAVVVCGGATATESVDRTSLALDQDEFISAVLARAASLEVPTAVVALAPGAVVLPWRDNATALLMLFLSGEATGDAAADILMGVASPSGRLPITLPASENDAIRPCPARAACEYFEELHGGWHVYDQTEVAYPFGHGLSYTSFRYSVARDWRAGVSDDDAVLLDVQVTNVGDREGADVAQLYLSFPPDESRRPKWLLRGFGKSPVLAPGQSHNVSFALRRRDLSVWNTVVHAWTVAEGSFGAFVGTSSRSARLCGGFDSSGGNFSGHASTPMVPCSGNLITAREW